MTTTSQNEIAPRPCQACNGYGSADGQACGTFDRDFGPNAPGPCLTCGGLGEDLDALTRGLTAFESFRALLEAGGGFRPTLATTPGRVTTCTPAHARRLRYLADQYDQAQANLGDDRRAIR